jgi:hypothetical protein
VAGTTHDRDTVEFSRTLAFTDGLFAIAATRWSSTWRCWKPEGADELLPG